MVLRYGFHVQGIVRSRTEYLSQLETELSELGHYEIQIRTKSPGIRIARNGHRATLKPASTWSPEMAQALPVFLGHSYADRTMSYSLGDAASHKPARYEQYCTDAGLAFASNEHDKLESKTMSLGLILVIILVIFLFGGFSGRFGGYGYGYGHGGVGVIGVILIIIVVLMLLGRI